MKTKWSLFLAALVMGAALPWPATAATQSWRYIVPPFHDTSDTPGLAPFGLVSIVPQGNAVTVTIADDVNPGGRFLFKICQPNDPHPGDYHCGYGHDDVSTGDICYEGPETLTGLVPGNPVEVILRWAPSPCPDAPTTGTLTIEG